MRFKVGDLVFCKGYVDRIIDIDYDDDWYCYHLVYFGWVTSGQVESLIIDNALNRKLYPNYKQYKEYLIPRNVEME